MLSHWSFNRRVAKGMQMTTQSPLFTGTAIVAAVIVHLVMCLAWLAGRFVSGCRRVDRAVDRLITDTETNELIAKIHNSKKFTLERAYQYFAHIKLRRR